MVCICRSFGRLISSHAYSYFDNNSNLREKKLNLFQVIARNLFGCYKETHLKTVQQKAYRATLEMDFSPEDKAQLKNIFFKAGRKFGWDTGYFVGSSTFFKEYDEKSKVENGEKLLGSLTVRYRPNLMPSNNMKPASQALTWGVECDIQISGELIKHTFKVKAPRSHDPNFIKIISPPNVTPAAGSFADYCVGRLLVNRRYLFENENSQQYSPPFLSANFIEGDLLKNFDLKLRFILDDQPENQAT